MKQNLYSTYRLLSFGATWHRSSGTRRMAALSILMRVRAVVPFRLGKVSTERASEMMLGRNRKLTHPGLSLSRRSLLTASPSLGASRMLRGGTS